MNKSHENFDDREIKMLYKENVQRTAPDMEKLWSRIERTIDEADKTETASQRAGIRTKNNMARLTAWAAALVLIVSVGALVLSREKLKAEEHADKGSTAASQPADNADAAEETNNAAASEQSSKPVSYEALPLGHKGIQTAAYTPAGDEYFVESSVLEKTQLFADVRVLSAEEHSGFCRYSLETVAVYQPDGTSVPGGSRETLDSTSPLLLSAGGEYLLPIRSDENGWHLVFENAPQTELTQDGRIVFHNGWQSLLSGSAECIYPENRFDEFYFDRMRIAPGGNIETLLTEWRELQV